MKKVGLIEKQRFNFVLSVTIISAVFLLIVLIGLWGLAYAVNEVYYENAFEKALHDPLQYNQQASPDMKCLFVWEVDGNAIQLDDDQIYGNDIQNIINGAIKTKQGRFQVGNNHFVVECISYKDGTLYAILDRTSSHDQFVNNALVTLLLYLCSIALIILLATLVSAKMLYPVTLAMKKQRDFVANTSHELKTPLTIISTNLSVIKSDPTSTIEDNEKWISSIDTQIKRMQELINNMLELSKIEQSEMPVSEVNFSSLTEGECLVFDPICFEKNLSIVSDLQPNVTLEGNEQMLDRLIVILLDNATKYCSDKGKIGVKLDADQKRAHLAVVNTGEPISKEDAEHVFDRFYRTDGARENDDHHSFGLGLSIAAATVNAHGGTITCRGIEGKGTVFDVYLPLKQKKKRKFTLRF